MTIHAQKWQWTVLQFQGIPAVPWILSSAPYHKQPTSSTKQWIHWSFGGHFKEVDGKVHQRWEMVELWIAAVSCNTHFQHHPITTWSPHRQETEDFTSPDPFDIGKSVESSRIHQELIKHQHPSSTSTSGYSMELQPGQPVFIKEVHGNIWKIETIDQPAKETDSYWVRFPDDSILRRTHQMIKPRLVPSHFKLESTAKERNRSEFIPSVAFSNFQSMLPALEHPALQTGNPVTPELSEWGTLPMRKDIPTSSPGVTQPSIPAVRRSSHSTKSVPPRRFSPSRTCTVLCSETQWKVLHFEQ